MLAYHEERAAQPHRLLLGFNNEDIVIESTRPPSPGPKSISRSMLYCNHSRVMVSFAYQTRIRRDLGSTAASIIFDMAI
jgi:hypothetical protein